MEPTKGAILPMPYRTNYTYNYIDHWYYLLIYVDCDF